MITMRHKINWHSKHPITRHPYIFHVIRATTTNETRNESDKAALESDKETTTFSTKQNGKSQTAQWRPDTHSTNIMVKKYIYNIRGNNRRMPSVCPAFFCRRIYIIILLLRFPPICSHGKLIAQSDEETRDLST